MGDDDSALCQLPISMPCWFITTAAGYALIDIFERIMTAVGCRDDSERARKKLADILGRGGDY